MPGSYHITPVFARYSTHWVPCHETGRYHHHQSHKEERLPSVCGLSLVRGRDQSCSASIANPDWDYDWCHRCVKAMLWNDDARGLWSEKGIKTLDHAAWKEWIETADGEHARGAAWPLPVGEGDDAD